MKTKIHAIAGGIAFLTILCFWTSTLYTELFSSHDTVAAVKNWILKGMFILIPAMMIAGGSGMSMAGNRTDAPLLRKKKRMPIVAATGLVVLLPAAFYLENKASIGAFDVWFYVIQSIELLAGASNLSLMFLNIQDGLRMTGKINNSVAPVNKVPDQKPSIQAIDNGPLMVKGMPPLADTDGNSITMKKTVALCRCGASNTKPFCDGSHNEIGFNCEATSSPKKAAIFIYKGQDIDVHYNKQLCSHAAICGAQLNRVFDTSKKPWVNPDNASVEEVKAVIQACPSGALSYAEPSGKAHHLIADKAQIMIEKNGPYHAHNIDLNYITMTQ
ncbi:MAG: (4Fe-4S)-binding protein, partial [Marinicella sp.]